MIGLDEACALVWQEARLLDERRWDDWLALWWPEGWFWMPAWRDDTGEPCASPDDELSLIYIAARAGLEDRIWRMRSGLSVASIALRRTVHLVGAPVLEPVPDRVPGRPAGVAADADAMVLHTAFSCHVWDTEQRTQSVLAGRYAHHLSRRDGRLGIAGKKIVLATDLIPTMADLYCV